MALAGKTWARQKGLVESTSFDLPFQAGGASSQFGSVRLLVMRNLSLRRALGAAAAFEKHVLNQRGRSDKAVSELQESLQAGLLVSSGPSVVRAAHGPQSSGIKPSNAKSFLGKATTMHLSARTDLGDRHLHNHMKEVAGWQLRALAQDMSSSRVPDVAVGNGRVGSQREDTSPVVVNGAPSGSNAIATKNGVTMSGDVNGVVSLQSSTLSKKKSLGQRISVKGHATAAVSPVEDNVEGVGVEQDAAEGTKYGQQAAQRAARAKAMKAQNASLKPPPARPRKAADGKPPVRRRPPKEKLDAKAEVTVTIDNPANTTGLSAGTLNEVASIDSSPITDPDTDASTPDRPMKVPLASQDSASESRAQNGIAAPPPSMGGSTPGAAANKAPKKERTLPPLAANGKALKGKGRQPPSPLAVEETNGSQAPGKPTSNGMGAPPGLPVFSNTVQPISRGFANPVVGKQPDTVRGAPLRDLLEENGIILADYTPGEYRILCPKCKGGDSKETSLSVTVKSGDDAVWHCFRGKCGWSSGVKSRYPARSASQFGGSYRPSTKTREAALQKKRFPATKLPRPEDFTDLDETSVNFFRDRKISEATLERNEVKMQKSYCPQLKEELDALAFPYYRRGELVNVKYRGPNKEFWQVKGAEKVFYGLDDIADSKTIIIVEGEIDKLAMEEAGYLNVVSVPDGAPAKAAAPGTPLPAPEDDRKYEYLWNCREYLDKASKFLLATDSDDPGQALAEELARRLGREKCWRVKWPVTATGQVKDANEALTRVGKSGLREAVEGAEAFPIRGLFKFESFFDEIDDYYNLQLGDERGVSTGWSGLDDLYRIVPGELSVVTGVPNSGKSEWLDALLCNLVQQRGWNFALCSMENKVRDHARKLIEKYVGAPFFDAPYGENKPRVSTEQLEKGKQWINQHFHVIRCEDDELPSIEWVLGLARAAVLRNGIRGLVIDPYNELDHQRPSRQTETEYVSQMLTKIKRFAQHHDCHVWFVAHPKQLQQWKGEAPGLYDISGSAHFVNKTDNGIVVHRNRDPETGPLDEVKILVRKVRNKAAGTIGEASLRYDRVTGRYEDVYF